MAQLRITFQATTGNQPSNGPNWNPTKEARFINWLWAVYSPKTPDGTPLPRTLETETEAFLAYAASIYAVTKANVRAWERSELERSGAVADMN